MAGDFPESAEVIEIGISEQQPAYILEETIACKANKVVENRQKEEEKRISMVGSRKSVPIQAQMIKPGNFPW